MRISDWSSDVCSADLGRISKQRLERLAVAIKEVLSAAILAGGSTLRDYARPDGELGYFSKQWRVYGREGAACLCGAVIRRRTDSGRSTFYRSEEHTSELQSLMRISYAVFCLQKKTR